MVKKYTTYRTLKKWVRVFIKCMIVVFFTMGLYLVISSLNLTAPIKEVLLSYDIEQNPNYKVNIYNNSYIDENSLLQNDNYITNLVSNIDLNFNYIYEATKKGDYNYNYDIKAIIYGEYQGSVENQSAKLWTKEYTLLENTTKEINNVNTFNINEFIKLDFQKYNNEVINFKNDLNVPINAYLEVIMHIFVKGNSEGNKIKDNKAQKFVIPLNQIAFTVKNDSQLNDHKEITHTEDNRSINMTKFDIGILMLVYSVMILLLTFRLIFKVKSKTKFEIELERILKSYGDVIIELASPININKKDIVLVKSFNEMLDLEEELRTPINFIQMAKDKGKFFIINNDICYVWYLEN